MGARAPFKEWVGGGAEPASQHPGSGEPHADLTGRGWLARFTQGIRAGRVAAFQARLQAQQRKGEIKIRKSRNLEPRASWCLHFTPAPVQEGRTGARRPLLEGMWHAMGCPEGGMGGSRTLYVLSPTGGCHLEALCGPLPSPHLPPWPMPSDLCSTGPSCTYKWVKCKRSSRHFTCQSPAQES